MRELRGLQNLEQISEVSRQTVFHHFFIESVFLILALQFHVYLLGLLIENNIKGVFVFQNFGPTHLSHTF